MCSFGVSYLNGFIISQKNNKNKNNKTMRKISQFIYKKKTNKFNKRTLCN